MPCFSQDIIIDTKGIKSAYQTDLKRSFKLTFINNIKNDELLIRLLSDDQGAPVLKKGVPKGTFSIDFTYKGDQLSVKDPNDKELPVNGNFKIKYEDEVFEIKQGPATIVINVNDIDNGGYTADFAKDFDIQLINNSNDPKLILSVQVGDKSSTLKTGFESGPFTIHFTSSDGKLTTLDQVGKTVELSSPFTLKYGKKNILVKSKVTVDPGAATKKATDDNKPIQTPYWSYLKSTNWSFSLSDLRKFVPDCNCCFSPFSFYNPLYCQISYNGCPSECQSCDDAAFDENNRVIYDAQSGLTYFVKRENATDYSTNKSKYIVDHKKNIKLSAGDPLILVIKNVNPALYDITLSDSVLLTNNQSNALLEALLLGRSESIPSAPGVNKAEGGSMSETDMKDYLTVKAALLVVQAEMAQTLEFYHTSNLYLHNCIVERKKAALARIDASLHNIVGTSYDKYTFLQMVNLFLDQSTVDSNLNHQLKALYGEFLSADYVIAHRLGQMPEQDMLFLRLGIIAKKNCPYPSLLSTTSSRPTQTIYIKNFFKVDVSTGLYYGFGKDENYALATRTSSVKSAAGGDSTIHRLYKENDGSSELGFMAFVHLYPKWGTTVNGSFTVGAGLSLTQTIRPRYFTGFSLLFGSNNRLCLTGGVMWGQFQQLGDQYEKTSGVLNDLPVSETSVNYKTTFKGTGFFAISYNLAFLNRSGNSDVKTANKSTN
ncbi:hypothetical protein GCM10023092_23050 [Rurimicrobium arvi]|uniref:Uncharacterized protein n=1 Tax=Rurimicrobium arvi TaxID=2049916 RepID=A0ABP8MYR4_9BACT